MIIVFLVYRQDDSLTDSESDSESRRNQHQVFLVIVNELLLQWGTKFTMIMIPGLDPAHQMRQTLLFNLNSMQAWTPKEKKENSAFVRFYPLGKIRKVQR